MEQEVAKALKHRHEALLQEVSKLELWQAVPKSTSEGGAELGHRLSDPHDGDDAANVKSDSMHFHEEPPQDTSSSGGPLLVQLVSPNHVACIDGAEEMQQEPRINEEVKAGPAGSQLQVSQDADSKKNYSSNLLCMLMDKHAPKTWVEKLVARPQFEFLVGVLIVLNTLTMAFEVQYAGLESGYLIGAPNYVRPASEAWPQAHSVFVATDYFFTISFTIELILRISAMKSNALKSPWIWMDFVLVVIGLVGWLPISQPGADPSVLRVVRLLRIGRVARIMRVVKQFDGLFLLIRSIEASVSALFWSFLVIMCAQVASGMLVSQTLREYIRDGSIAQASRIEVFNYWGTFTQTMLTMSEITLANWIVSCRVLVDNVGEQYAMFYLVYRCVFCFAVLRVITAVFIAETQRVVASDDEIAILKREQARDVYIGKIRDIFKELDDSGDGLVNKEEFDQLMTDPVIRDWLSTMDLEVTELETVFKLLDDGDGNIEVDEFIKGVGRVRGNAKSIDMVNLISLTKKMDAKIEGMQKKMDKKLDDLAKPSVERVTSFPNASQVKLEKFHSI